MASNYTESSWSAELKKMLELAIDIRGMTACLSMFSPHAETLTPIIRGKIVALRSGLDVLFDDFSRIPNDDKQKVHRKAVMDWYLLNLESHLSSMTLAKGDGSLHGDIGARFPSSASSSDDPQGWNQSRQRTHSEISDSWIQMLNKASRFSDDNSVQRLISAIQRKISILDAASDNSELSRIPSEQPMNIHETIENTFFTRLESVVGSWILDRTVGGLRTNLDPPCPPSIRISDDSHIADALRGSFEATSQSSKRNYSEISENGINVPLDVPCPHCPFKQPNIAEHDIISEEDCNSKGKEVSSVNEPTLCCPICLLPLTNACSTICGHIFCEDCIKTSVQKQKKCPTCRRKLTKRSFHKVYLPTPTI